MIAFALYGISQKLNCRSLPALGMEQFSDWLQTTPTRISRGSKIHISHGVFEMMKDPEPYVKFLYGRGAGLAHG